MNSKTQAKALSIDKKLKVLYKHIQDRCFMPMCYAYRDLIVINIKNREYYFRRSKEEILGWVAEVMQNYI